MRWMVIAAVCVGCGKGKAQRFEGPMPITLGACSGPTVKFVSGPRPLPFSRNDAEPTGAKIGSTPAAKPPQPAPDDSGGTGTALALDQARHGDNDRRQEAIDQAREAGILGSTTPDHNALASSSEDSSGFGPPKPPASPPRGDGAGPHRTPPDGGAGHDKQIIRRFIKRHIEKIQYCYENQLRSRPALAGTVKAEFFINPGGVVESSSATGVDPDVASCIADVIRGIEFPRPQSGGGVHVSYPFSFQPASDPEPPTTSAAAPGPGSGSAASAVDVPPAPPEPPPTGSHGDELFRPADADHVDATYYRPETGNPLGSQAPALEGCLRKNPQHHGALVVELRYDATGTVTDAEVYGIADPRTSACLIATAKLVKHSGATAERCGLAFGEMQLADLPAIDIDTDIAFGAMRIPTHTVVADERPITRIPDLQAAVAATVKAAMAATVSLHGPIVVRPEDATPMKVVVRVLGSVLAGGDDFVLAHRRGAAWEPLYRMTLPIAPVPIGTGGKWNPVKGQARNGTASLDDEDAVLSVLIDRDRIWIGLSRIGESQQVVRDAGQAEKLVAILKAHKASGWFADRADIEIAAADDVPYGDVVAVIANVREVGFVDWQLTDPAGLAARPGR